MNLKKKKRASFHDAPYATPPIWAASVHAQKEKTESQTAHHFQNRTTVQNDSRKEN